MRHKCDYARCIRHKSPVESKASSSVCGSCKVTTYCSRECQAKDWREGTHKKECKKLKEWHQDNPDVRCGLCRNKRPPFRKTDCCGRWVCDDHNEYELMSYARTSCARNHERYTICAFHHNEGHQGNWKTCKECKDGFDAYDFWTMATNPPEEGPNKNFPDDVLDIPKPPLPKCGKCDREVDTIVEPHSTMAGPDGKSMLVCVDCFGTQLQ